MKFFFAHSISFVVVPLFLCGMQPNNQGLLKTKNELYQLAELPAGSLKNINNLKKIQKKLTKIACNNQQELTQNEIKQINTILMPYSQQLINTQTFFLSTKAADLKLFLPFVNNLQKNFESFDSSARNARGDTILQHALRLGVPRASIEYLLLCGQSINATNKNKKNALHIATSQNNKKVLELLLSHQDEVEQFFKITTETSSTYKDIDAQDNLGQTPLHKACIKNLLGCIKLLVASKASPTIQDNNNKQPLDYVFELPWTQTSATICQILTDSYESNMLSQDHFYTSILKEIKQIPPENLKNLTSNLKEKIESYNNITIFQAIEKNVLTSEILKRKSNTINEQHKGKTPLCLCLLSPNPQYCKLLLEYNADPNKKSNVKVDNLIFVLTPLECLSYTTGNCKECREIVTQSKLMESLLQHGADPNLGILFPPLHHMAALNKNKEIDLLLNHKANVNMLDCAGLTALHVACKSNCGKSAVALLAHNADPDIINTNKGKTALDYCYSYKHDALVLLLLAAGATKCQKEFFINGKKIADKSIIRPTVNFYGTTTKIIFDESYIELVIKTLNT